MLDGVLHQRLDQHGRHQASAGRVVHRALHPQAVAEAHLFDGEEVPDQHQLLAQRHHLVRFHSQALAKKAGQLQRHATRRASVAGSERADRIEAIEQKVRIDLGAQHAQLGLLRHQHRFELAPLGAAGAHKFDHHVVYRCRAAVQQYAQSDDQRRQLRRDHESGPRHVRQRGQRIPQVPDQQPQHARDHGRHRQHRRDGAGRARTERIGAAQVIGGVAGDQRIDHGHRHREQHGVGQRRIAGQRDHPTERQAEEQPHQHVDGGAATLRERFDHDRAHLLSCALRGRRGWNSRARPGACRRQTAARFFLRSRR